jgi:hypothetical protein
MPNGPDPALIQQAQQQQQAALAAIQQAAAALVPQHGQSPQLQSSIDELTNQQNQLAQNQLSQVLHAPTLQAALTNAHTVTAALNQEAANIGVAANVLNTAAKMVGYAAQLVGIFATFA